MGLSVPSQFTRQYLSGAQAIINGGLLTLAHGFGVEPKCVKYFLTCATAELGYSIGDVVEVSANSYVGTSAVTFSPYFDTTNIYVRYGTIGSFVFSIGNKTTGVKADITGANWTFSVKAWA